MKQVLFERINTEIAPARAEYERLIANPREIEDLLQAGAEKARAVSRPFLAEIRATVGMRALARCWARARARTRTRTRTWGSRCQTSITIAACF
jgi:tryptophanyl-tRNA synthetase